MLTNYTTETTAIVDIRRGDRNQLSCCYRDLDLDLSLSNSKCNQFIVGYQDSSTLILFKSAYRLHYFSRQSWNRRPAVFCGDE